MSVIFKFKNEEQNRQYQKLLDNYYEGLKQPSLICVENVELIIDNEQSPILNKCSFDCEKKEFDFDKVACILLNREKNYSHFILEVLAKIIQINAIDSQIPILIYNNETFESVLKYFKISNPVHSLKDGKYHIKNCYQFENYSDHKTTLEDLNLIRSRVSIAEEGDLCVLIRRYDSNKHIINFEKLYRCLVNNFPEQKWVVFESQPFHEMIKIFIRAKIIIAPHGTGVCNAIFSPKNVSIMELYPENFINLNFIYSTYVLKFNHYLSSTDASNFKFDIDEVLQTVLKIVRK